MFPYRGQESWGQEIQYRFPTTDGPCQGGKSIWLFPAIDWVGASNDSS